MVPPAPSASLAQGLVTACPPRAAKLGFDLQNAIESAYLLFGMITRPLHIVEMSVMMAHRMAYLKR